MTLNDILLRLEAAKAIINSVATSVVLDEQTFGEVEAEYFEARREVLDWLDVTSGAQADRLLEALNG